MVVCYKRPAKGKRIAPDEDDQFFCPGRAYIGDNMIPRALPWASCCWPFGPSSPLSIESVAFVADGIAYTDVYKE